MKKLNGSIRCYSLIGSLSLSLVACGGSSGSGSSAPAEVNTAPLATDVALTLSSNGPWVGTEVNVAYAYSDDQNDTEGVTQFRWLRDGTAIEGAAGATYTLQADDADKSIVAEVTPIATTGVLQGEPVVSTAIIPVQNQAPVFNQVSIQPLEAGLFVGLNIEAVVDYSDADNDLAGDHVYQWLRNGEAIAGANQKTYKMLEVDAEQQITVSVTPVATAGQSPGEAVVSSPIVPVVNSAPVAENVHMNFGDSAADSDVPYSAPKVGITITGHYQYSDLDGDEAARPDVRWLRDNQVIEGATTASYTVQAEDEGKRLSFEVTPKALTGWMQGSAHRSEASSPAVVNFAPQARNVRLEFDDKKIKVGTQVTVAYDYFDEDGDAEKGTSVSFRLNGNLITTSQYGRFTADENKIGDLLTAEVTPRAITGAPLGEAVLTVVEAIYPLDRLFFTAKLKETWSSSEIENVIGLTDGRSAEKTHIVKKHVADSEPSGWYIPEGTVVTRPVDITTDPESPKWLYTEGGYSGGTLVTVRAQGDGYVAEYLEGDIASSQHRLVKEIYRFNDKAFFSSFVDSYGSSLWMTDGTIDGTEFVADISSLPLHIDGGYHRPRQFVEFNKKLYFTATNNGFTGSAIVGNGEELWVYEGKLDGEHKVSMVKDIYPGVEDSRASGFTEFDGALYFAAIGGPSQGKELWKTDGTEDGTQYVATLAGAKSADGSKPTNFTVVGERLFFTAFSEDEDENKAILWILEKGSDTPVRAQGVPATHPQGFVTVSTLTEVGNDLYFVINNNDLYVIRHDTDTAIQVLPALGVGTVRGIYYVAEGQGKMYFRGFLEGVGNRLFKVNGSYQMEVLSNQSHDPGQPVAVNGRLLFPATDSDGDRELWFTGGTAETTSELKDINNYGSSYPELNLQR